MSGPRLQPDANRDFNDLEQQVQALALRKGSGGGSGTGPAGPAGPTGATGPIGPAGPAGPAGPQGLIGPTGNPGALGPQGIQGVKGDAGATGTAGAQGVKGDQGIKGDKGDPGVAGVDGATGPAGATGPKGDKGDKGDTGATGAAATVNAAAYSWDCGSPSAPATPITFAGSGGNTMAVLAIPATPAAVTEPAGAFTRNADGSVQPLEAGWYSLRAEVQIDNVNTRITVMLDDTTGTALSSHSPLGMVTGTFGPLWPVAEVTAMVKLAAGQKVYVLLAADANVTTGVRSFSMARVGGPKGVDGAAGPIGPGGASGPSARVAKAAQQDFTSAGGSTPVAWGTVQTNPDGMYSAASPTRLTALSAGMYHASTNVRLDGMPLAAQTRILMMFVKNGTTEVCRVDHIYVAGDSPIIPMAASVYLNANDYLEVNVLTTGSPARAYGDGGVACFFALVAAAGPKGDTGGPAQAVSVAQDAWHVIGAAGEPAFGASWNAYSAPTFHAPAFQKDPAGRVHLRGLFKRSAVGTGDQTLFTLPVGYRPASWSIFQTWASYEASGAQVNARLDVYPDGNVILRLGTVQVDAVSIEGIDFGTNQATFPAGAATIPQEGWHTVGAAGEPQFKGSPLWASTTLRFKKKPDGTVRIVGQATGGASGQVVFTLPPGYWPDQAYYQVALGDNGVAGNFMTVGTNGDVIAYRPAAGNFYFEHEIDTGQTTWPMGSFSPIPLVATLPVAPLDGQEVYYQNAAMAAAGVVWHLRYRSAASGGYKWDVLSGTPLLSEQTASSPLSNAGYVDPTPAGPSVALPLAGDYQVGIGAAMRSGGTSSWAAMSYAIGATAAVDADAIFVQGVLDMSASRTKLKAGLSAVTLTAKYRDTYGANGSAQHRWISAMPVRVG